MYYDEGRTMEAVAAALGVSRSTVSRLLRDARDEGIVRISLHPPGARRAGDLARCLERTYGIRTVVVPVREGTPERDRLQAVSATAAAHLQGLLAPGMTVGLAWGTTVAAVVGHLTRQPLPGLRIVQLNGAINTEGSGLTYASTVLARAAAMWDAAVDEFPVPAFFDYPETRAAMWRERSVRRVLEAQHQCSLAVFGVGAFDAEVPSHAYTANYLTERDLRQLRSEGAVGDVCTVFLRADGTSQGLSLNDRSSGPAPEQLADIPRRLLIASGSRKAVPLRAALLAGVATDLVVDEVTAGSLLALG